MSYKKLVISPHIDDEVLGCGGILDKDTFVLYCGVENRYINGDMSISVVTRIQELEKVSKFLNFDFKSIPFISINIFLRSSSTISMTSS